MTSLDALQQTLAAEHAAVYAYGVLGGRAAGLLDPDLRGALAGAYDAHVTRRDQLRQMVSALGTDPVAAEPAYGLPRSLATGEQLTTQALRIERACVQQYAGLVAATGPGDARAWAVTALDQGALTELDFGGSARPLPGVALGAPPRASS